MPDAKIKNPTVVISRDPVIEPLTITENGTYTAPSGVDGFSSVTVNVENLLEKFLTNTLTKFRTMLNYPGGIIVPNVASGTTQTRTNIEYWEMPNRTASLEVWGYAHLTKLKRLDAGKTTRVDNVSLSGDGALKQLILRKSDAISTLYSANTIPNNPALYIYVPSTLIEEYKTATNWTSHASKFRNFYIAESIEEKEQMLTDPTIPAESMIVCDVDETYTIKEE